MTKQTDIQGLVELAERCEQVAGPDRKLDRDIAHEVIGWPLWMIPSNRSWQFTASLDAAMTLVPEGYEWRAAWSELPDRTWAGIAGVQGVTTSAATPALALCAAALRARAPKQQAQG